VKAATIRSNRSPRWDFMRLYRVEVGGQPFLTRLRIVQCPWFAVLLTRIYQEDEDRDPHNHSRAFCTFILSGSYSERVTETGQSGRSWDREHRRFSVRYMPQAWAHRITRIDGRLTTLVVAGRHHGTWYFWTEDGPVDWKDYG
jgi:hypothetical protein